MGVLVLLLILGDPLLIVDKVTRLLVGPRPSDLFDHVFLFLISLLLY